MAATARSHGFDLDLRPEEAEDLRDLYPKTANAVIFVDNLTTSAALNTYLVSHNPEFGLKFSPEPSRAPDLVQSARFEVTAPACKRMRAKLVNLAVFAALL